MPRDLDILTMGCSAISPYFSTRALRAPFFVAVLGQQALALGIGLSLKGMGFRPRIMPWEVRFW